MSQSLGMDDDRAGVFYFFTAPFLLRAHRMFAKPTSHDDAAKCVPQKHP
jgi:hypothetical protein